MMKKFMVVLAALAIAGISSMAFAADVSVSGSVDIRSRDYQNLDLNKNLNGDNIVDTQERVRLAVDAKTDSVKGKVEIENDWDDFGRFEKMQGNQSTDAVDYNRNSVAQSYLQIRQAWLSANVPGLPVNLTVGHQLLMLGQGWWFRSMKFGSDAWTLANAMGNNTAAFVNVKVSEGIVSNSDDIDAYVLLDVLKLDENNTVGIDLTMANDRDNNLGFGGTASTAETQAQNLGLNYTGKLGMVGLKAELDLQAGKAKGNDAKFKGNQIVVQGTVPVDPVTINFTVARGSGDKAGDKDIKRMVTFLDSDPHYTLLYEYHVAGPCGLHSGFCNTTALNVGASANVSKTVTVGGDIWALQSTEKVADVTSTTGGTTNDLGTEVDLKVNWQMYDNLSWNWTLAYLTPGNGLGKDDALGAQGVLSMKF
jgi:hypothetical protein